MTNTIVVTGGGTGGHLSVARSFIDEFYSRGYNVIFIGSIKGQDKQWFENHPKLFQEAMEYEKDGYTWQQGESLKELCSDERRESIKREHYIRIKRQKSNFQSPNLVDILTNSSSEEWEIDWEEEEGRGCAACFI